MEILEKVAVHQSFKEGVLAGADLMVEALRRKGYIVPSEKQMADVMQAIREGL